MEHILESSDLINSFPILFSYMEILTLKSWKFANAKQNHLHQCIWGKIIHLAFLPHMKIYSTFGDSYMAAC